MNIVRWMCAFWLLAVPGWANAVPVAWTLDNVIFNDGGTALGSFTYDADLNSYTAIAITTTAGTAAPGYTYFGQQTGNVTASQLVALLFDTPTPFMGQNALLLRYVNPLTNAGGTVALVPGTVVGPITQGSGESGYFTGPIREVVSGTLSATVVPLPPAAALFLSAAALLTGIRRRG
jgi:hypothetical protein